MRLFRTLLTTKLHNNPIPPLSPHHPFLTRPFATTLPLHNSNSNKNDQNKKSALLDRSAVNTEPNEYSKSDSDAGAASQEDPAFQAGKTDPQSELESSEPGEQGLDPLNISPANTEISQPRGREEGGAEKGCGGRGEVGVVGGGGSDLMGIRRGRGVGEVWWIGLFEDGATMQIDERW